MKQEKSFSISCHTHLGDNIKPWLSVTFWHGTGGYCHTTYRPKPSTIARLIRWQAAFAIKEAQRLQAGQE